MALQTVNGVIVPQVTPDDGVTWAKTKGDANGRQEIVLYDASGNALLTAANPGNVQVVGSSAPLNYEAVAASVEGTAAVRSIALGSAKRITRIINDDTTEARFGFDAAPVAKIDDTGLTRTGTWTHATNVPAAYGGGYYLTTTSGDLAVLNPGVSVAALGLLYIKFNNGCIANVEFSEDGATWLSPSAIAGIRRGDGATGATMDTIDTYDAASTPSAAPAAQMLYVMPYPSTWQMRVTHSGTANGSAVATYSLYVDGALQELAGAALSVKAGEPDPVNVEASTLYFYAPGGSARFRVQAE